MSKYEIVGLMSGTSLDGLDIVHSRFAKKDEKWTYDILNSETIPYSGELLARLQKATEISEPDLKKLDKDFAHEMALMVNLFLSNRNIDDTTIDAIASHGQTVFHQPDKGFSLQIGCGKTLAAETGLPVINDFRNGDIREGGQGAPLVPIGDKLLFSDSASAFLNLGGFCNISFVNEKEKWIAFDIAPCNLPLNKIANQKGQEYDKGGEIAKQGTINLFLLDLLNKLEYYNSSYPKSLGTEWLEGKFYPLVKFSKTPEDNMRTLLDHTAIQIANVLTVNKLKSVLVTGGGAFNSFLIERIKHHSDCEVVLPSKEIIEFKEALIFAFLGALHLNNEPSNVPSATGARKEVSLGVLHQS